MLQMPERGEVRRCSLLFRQGFKRCSLSSEIHKELQSQLPTKAVDDGMQVGKNQLSRDAQQTGICQYRGNFQNEDSDGSLLQNIYHS